MWRTRVRLGTLHERGMNMWTECNLVRIGNNQNMDWISTLFMNFLSILSRFYILALQLDLKSMFSNGAGSESLLVRYLWLVYVLCAYHWFILQRERAAIFLTTNYITIALYIEDQVQRVLTEIYLKKFEIKMGKNLEKLYIFRTQLVWSGLLDFR